MQHSITPSATPQRPGLPVVSWQLMLRHGARRDARRRGVSPAVAEQAVVGAYLATGNRFQARRAGWQAVDRLAWPGTGEG